MITETANKDYVKVYEMIQHYEAIVRVQLQMCINYKLEGYKTLGFDIVGPT